MITRRIARPSCWRRIIQISALSTFDGRIEAYCNSVKHAQGARFGRLSKTGPKGLAAMPTVGEIGSADLCGCRFVKGKSAAQIVDEHWLDDGMSKPGRKTRQGHRLTRMGAVEEFGSEGIGSLHADANSAAQELVACTQMRIRQSAAACASQGLDLARSKTWMKDCPRHTNDSTADAAKQAVGTALWTGRTWVKWQHHGGRMWEHNWALQAAETWDHAPSLARK